MYLEEILTVFVFMRMLIFPGIPRKCACEYPPSATVFYKSMFKCAFLLDLWFKHWFVVTNMDSCYIFNHDLFYFIKQNIKMIIYIMDLVIVLTQIFQLIFQLVLATIHIRWVFMFKFMIMMEHFQFMTYQA